MPNWETSFVGSDRTSGQGKGATLWSGPRNPPAPGVPSGAPPGSSERPEYRMLRWQHFRGAGGKLWPIGVGTYDRRPRATPATDVSRGQRTIATKSGPHDAGGGVEPVADYLVNRLTLHGWSEVQVESHRYRRRSSAPVSDGLARVRRAGYSVSAARQSRLVGHYGWCRMLLTRRKDRPGFSVSGNKIRGGCLGVAGAGFRQP